MSARDDLARVISPYVASDSAMFRAADAVIAEGWRSPARVIETHGELASMEDGTVIRDSKGGIAEKRDWPLDLAVRYFDGMHATNEDIPLPATVLWESGDPR